MANSTKFAVGGGNLVELFDATDTPICTLTAIQSSSGSGAWENRLQFSVQQADQSLRETLASYYIRIGTPEVTFDYEDGDQITLYPGDTKAREDTGDGSNRILKFVKYESGTTGEGKRVVNYGLCYLGGESGSLDTSANSVTITPLEFFPVTATAEDVADGTAVFYGDTGSTDLFDSTKVTNTTDQALEAGQASKEVTMTI